MTTPALPVLVPGWTPPPGVRSLVTTRQGGCSVGPYASLNLGIAVGDAPERVADNRARLQALLPAAPCWLRQVHGARVVNAALAGLLEEADASFTTARGVVCIVQMADCLPVLFSGADGSVVAAAHAGWRGLAAGVLERTIEAMGAPPSSVLAWLGPAIGPRHFEVGDDVREAFTAANPMATRHFEPGARGKWKADLFALARQRLAAAGITRISGGGECTFSDDRRFFSHRRDGVSGRMAAMVWIDPAGHA